MTRKLNITEHDIQVSYFDWVRHMAQSDHRYLNIYAVPNAQILLSRLPENLKYATLNYMKSEGLTPGILDINIDYPIPFPDPEREGFLFPGAKIETKHGRGRLSPDQILTIERNRRRGFIVSVCYTFSEMKEFTQHYFRLEKKQ